MFAFNKVHVGEHLLTYICGSKDRQDSKCIRLHGHRNVGVSNTSLSGLGRSERHALNCSLFLLFPSYKEVFGHMVSWCSNVDASA